MESTILSDKVSVCVSMHVCVREEGGGGQCNQEAWRSDGVCVPRLSPFGNTPLIMWTIRTKKVGLLVFAGYSEISLNQKRVWA